MSGNCETGSRKKQIAPASTMMTAIAEAKIGRWMKKLTIGSFGDEQNGSGVSITPHGARFASRKPAAAADRR